MVVNPKINEKMKKLYIIITLPLLLLAGNVTFAQESVASQLDSIQLGDLFRIKANGNAANDASIFEKSPEIDVAKALYGQFSGLLVNQGTGRSEENLSELRFHGNEPLVLIDGFPREMSDITNVEIESITLLKDAASAALYGVKGANGVIMITTKRGSDSPLKVTAKYQYGLATMFRAPEFADAYTYGTAVNQARYLDGLGAKYDSNELNALKSGSYPYAYPNVNWMDEIYRSHGDNHRYQMTFTGGSRNFRYFTAVDYYKDDAMYVKPTDDDRYNAKVYDNRLGIRANVDVNITESTSMKVGVMARLSEFNTPNWDTRVDKLIYATPAAAFPVKQEDGVWGGSSIYGENNPAAQLQATGQHQYSQTKVLANAILRQDFNAWLKGLSADVSVAFDYNGKSTETATKEYSYSELVSSMATGTPVSEQRWYGKDSQVIEFDHWLNTLYMKFELNGRINWERNFGKSHIESHLAYRQRSWIRNERNASSKTQEILGSVSYNWNGRIFADAVLNYSGSAYLPKGDRFKLYPALNVAAIVLDGDPYLKVYGSAGISGWDNNLEHELFRQVYGSSNAKSYRFGPDGGDSTSGKAEGDMAALTLAPERSAKGTFGIDSKFFGRRLGFNAEAFIERRSNLYINTANISEVIGIGVNKQSVGEAKYKGIDLSLNWKDKIGDFSYGLYANGGWLFTKVVNDGQAFQPYDYLYHAGNPIGQCYGLEVIGIFQNQLEINNSPKQTFSDVRPGDLKYRDQNADGVVDSNDMVRMFGSDENPVFQFGFGLDLAYKGFKVFADFQGVTGLTVSLLDSPLYQPLVSNSSISNTFLNREIAWTPETATVATMPRLTTLENENNYRDNSLWYRDGSFIKLRNVGISYDIPKSVLKICGATVALNGTNLFSCDNIKFADPEQLGAYYPSTRVIWASLKLNF